MALPVPKQLRKLTVTMAFLRKFVIAKAYPQTPFPRFEEFERLVRHGKERAVYASASEMYYAAFFGRDTIEAAEDLLLKDPSFAKDVIPLLAAHQGTQYNLLTEEEPGRIHHEYRMSPETYLAATGEKLPKSVAHIYETLSRKWNGNEREMTYYGSVDATPLYIKLIADYIFQTNDRDILTHTYTDKDNQIRTIQDSLLAAIEWLITRIEKGLREDLLSLIKPKQPEKRLPLLEYKRATKDGIQNQIWKDSQTAVIHENGKLPNLDYPIATIELQGHAYDALIKTASLLQDELPREAQRWASIATQIQEIIFSSFWLPDRNYFAQAIDRSIHGRYQIIKTLTSDQTELLNTTIFDTLSQEDYQKYVSGIVINVYSHQFLTDVGIRSRSLSYDHLVDFWDYHGTRTVWIKATYDFAKGLEKQGFYELSTQLKIRILNGVRIAGSFAELFYVAPNGQVLYKPAGKKQKKHEEIAATTIPEHMQTWTASAVAAIEYEFSHPMQRQPTEDWKKKVEQAVLEELPMQTLITSPRKAYKALPKHYGYNINLEKGKESEEIFTKNHQPHVQPS